MPNKFSILRSKLSEHIVKAEILRYLGPGFLITIGFIDPGNWATNIAGGAEFNYSLLWVVTLGTFMLIVLQGMSARLGIVSGKSLAKNVREHYPKFISWLLGSTIILACVATDVAELLGGTIGFHILLGFPYWLGALVTIFLEFYLIFSQKYHSVEKIIIMFLSIISLSYIIELFIVKPNVSQMIYHSVMPSLNGKVIYVAMGILGAIVMPHNIYLHSNVIQSRDWSGDYERKKKLIKYEQTDTTLAMLTGWFVNVSMIAVAAAVFFKHHILVDDLLQASETLRPLAGPLAQLLFAIALLFAGISSSTTSSMAEANVITGYFGKNEDPKSTFYRLSLIITSIPAFFIILFSKNFYHLLILSQVVLSIQLPFTIIPLILLSTNSKLMGKFKLNKRQLVVSTTIAVVIIGLNVFLLIQTFWGG
jgi:manganese transport protein